MACYVPSAQYEGVRHILRDAGSETGAGHKPCECLGGAGRTSGAGPSHHGFRGKPTQRSTFYHLAKSGRPVFWPIS